MYHVDLSIPDSLGDDDAIKLRTDFVDAIFTHFGEDMQLNDRKQITVLVTRYDPKLSQVSQPFSAVLVAPRHMKDRQRLRNVAQAVKTLSPAMMAYDSAYRLVLDLRAVWVDEDDWAGA